MTAASMSSPPNAIVDSSLHVKHDLGDAAQRNADFFRNPSRRSHLASQLLVYDTILIPTNDYAVVPELINWLGDRDFEIAVESGAIGFIHRRGLLGYVGAGHGIQRFTMQPEEKSGNGVFPFWWQTALFCGPAEAIEIQLAHKASSLSPTRRAALALLVLSHSRPVTFEDDFFEKNIGEESYRDVQNSPELRAAVIELAGTGTPTVQAPMDLLRLPGVTDTSFQVATDGPPVNAPDLLLRVAEMNMEVALAGAAGEADIYVSEGTEQILRSRLLTSATFSVPDGFGRLLELNGIPDVRVAVQSGAIDFKDVWKLRQKKLAREFRSWLRAGDVGSVRELEKLYVATLGEPMSEHLPLRSLRFALTTIVGLFFTIPGVVVSAADGFFLSKFVNGYRPKLMLDELRRLALY